MAILVTGGAGYIGSVVVHELVEKGESVVVIDNLVYGHRENVPPSVPFYEGDIGDSALLEKIFKTYEFSACMHFSAFAYVGESVKNPRKYFQNNVIQTITLLDQLLDHDIKKFIFSSTCATYGEPEYVPIDEKHLQNPTNPYGWSKLMVEGVLESYAEAYDLKFVSLRYFNAAGATENLGEQHDPETHLIPLVLLAASGKRDSISIFGNDYSTPDGTAIRDYIHVSDLSSAHILALDYLQAGGDSDFFNLGNGDGYSVKEVVTAAGKVTGKDIKTEIAPRREGDPTRLIADAKKAQDRLKWKPKITGIEEIIETAWKWLEGNSEKF